MSANTIGCGCANGQQNTGIDGQQLFGTTVAKYIFYDVADDGTRNGLDLNATDLGQELLDRINHTDDSKRFYPVYELKNVVPEKTDPTTWTGDDGFEVKLLEGIKSQNHLVVGASPQFYSKVRSMCGAMSEILVDDCGNLQGVKESKTGTTLYGRRINNLSYNADFMNKTNSDPSQIMMTYQYKRIDGDQKLWLVPADEFGSFDPLDLLGMLDVNITPTALTNSTIQVDCTFDYGTALALNPWIGAQASDFTVVNITSGSNPVVDSIAADPVVEGRYVITITVPLPTASDDLRVDVFRAATSSGINGYEGQSDTFESL